MWWIVTKTEILGRLLIITKDSIVFGSLFKAFPKVKIRGKDIGEGISD
jgi:hypothetical protein